MNTEKQPVFPTPVEIKQALEAVEKLLLIKQLNMSKNFHVKEGLIECKRILEDRLENPENKWFRAETESEIAQVDDIYRNQLAGIEKLKTIQGRSIAVICVDYLNGQVGSECFDNFKKMIKMR